MKASLLLNPVWMLLLFSGVSAECPPGSPNTNVDVALIGTGWAAVSAALTIQKYIDATSDNINYVMIERASTVGGREKTAHWLHGGRQVPLGDLLTEYAPDLWSSIIENQRWHDTKHWFCGSTCTGWRKEGKFKPTWRAFYTAYEDCLVPACLAFQQAGGGPQDNLRNALEQNACEWKNPDDEKGTLKTDIEGFEILQYFPNSELNLDGVSMWSVPERMWYENKDSDLFISDPRNFNLVLQRVVSGAGLGPIKTSYDVELIEALDIQADPTTTWDAAKGVKLHLRKLTPGPPECITYTAKKVVSTMSVGVWLIRGASLFRPALADKINSLEKVLEMGTPYAELIFQFGRLPDDRCPVNNFPAGQCPWEHKPFDDTYQHIFVEKEDSYYGPFVSGIYQVLDTQWAGEFYDGSRAVYTTVVGDVPYGRNSAQRKTWANDILADTLGSVKDYEVRHYDECTEGNPYADDWDITDKNDPQFPSSGTCKFFIYDKVNPSWHGAWPNWKVQSSIGDIEEFEDAFKPFPDPDPVMYTSGDGWCRRYYGHQSGAITSGMKTGETVLAHLGKTPVSFFPYTCEVEYP